MLAKRIIPCLDVTGGRVVKGTNFVDLRDAGDPVEIARRYDEQGADELTFLDITATSDERDLILKVIEDVAAQVFIPLTVGGGVRKAEDVRRLLNAGADKVSINSAGVNNPDLIAEASSIYGSQAIVVAIDAKRRSDGTQVGFKFFQIGSVELVKVNNLTSTEFTESVQGTSSRDAVPYFKFSFFARKMEKTEAASVELMTEPISKLSSNPTCSTM